MVTDVYDFDFLISSQNVQKAGNPQLSGIFLEDGKSCIDIAPREMGGGLGYRRFVPLASPKPYPL